MSKQISVKSICSFLLLIIQVLFEPRYVNAAAGSCVATLGSANINQATTWTLKYTPTTVSANINYISFFFNSQVFPTTPTIGACTSSAATNYNTATPTCTVATATGGFTVKVSTTTASQTSYQVTVAGITTSYSTQLVPIVNPIGTCTTFTVGNIQLETQKLTLSTSTFTAKAITTAIFTTNSGVNGAGATLSISATTTDKIPINGRIVITLPKQLTNYVGIGLTSTTQSLIPNCLSSACTPTFTTSTATVGGTNYFLSISAQFGTTQDMIIINTNNAGSMINAGALLVNVGPINNPPSLNPLSGYGFYTADSKGNQINYQSSILVQTSAFGAFSATGSTAYIIYGNTIGSTDNTQYYSIVTTNPIPEGGYLTIQIDPTLTLTTNPPVFTCVSKCDSSSASVTVSAQTITISGVFPTGYYAAKGTQIQFTLKGMDTPFNYNKYNYVVSSYDSPSNNFGIDQITFQMSALYGLTINTAKPTYWSKLLPAFFTQWKFGFTITGNTILTTDYIVIKFPLAFKLVSSGSCTLVGLGSSYTCKVSSSSTSKTIKITNFYSSTIADGSDVSFFVNKIKNSNRASGTIQIAIYDNTNTVKFLATKYYNY